MDISTESHDCLKSRIYFSISHTLSGHKLNKNKQGIDRFFCNTQLTCKFVGTFIDRHIIERLDK